MATAVINLGRKYRSKLDHDYLIKRISEIVWGKLLANKMYPIIDANSSYMWDLGGNDWKAFIHISDEGEKLDLWHRYGDFGTHLPFRALVRFLLFTLNLEEENDSLVKELDYPSSIIYPGFKRD